MNNGQVGEVLDRTANVPEPGADLPGGGERPLVPFPSPLELTREQEERVIDHFFNRLTTLEAELGRDKVRHQGWMDAAGEETASGSRTFLGKREIYEAIYHNHLEWRPAVLGGIFKESNLVVPFARRIVRQMVARANNYFFSTDPWFAAEPEGVEDRALAEKIERHAKWKFRNNKVKTALETANELAFIRGECVVKTGHSVREQIYRTRATILVDVEGNPVFDSQGGYIFEHDRWTNAVIHDEETGEPMPVPGIFVLERDSETVMPEEPIWIEETITQRMELFRGPEAGPVYYKDFLCPLTAEDEQKADTIVHLYDMPLMDLADLYGRRDLLDTDNEEASFEATQKAVELIRSMSAQDGNPKSGRNQPRTHMGENDAETLLEDPVAEICEFWGRFDVNGDGIYEEVMVLCDRQTRLPIYYDYAANVTPDGKRPFKVVRPYAVDGRWYGIGGMEMFESTQTIVDLLVNRWNHSQSKAGRVDLFRPYNTIEGESNPHLQMNWGATYTPKPNMRKEDVIESVYLNDIKHESLKNMFEFFLQIGMNESGVQHANDAQMVGLEKAELATGIRNIEKSGMEMFSLYLSHLEPGLEEILNRLVKILYANLDRKEMFSYFETRHTETVDPRTGQPVAHENAVRRLAEITPEEVAGLKMNVSLLMTRYKGEQQLQQGIHATQIVEKFYGLHPFVQAQVAPLYRQMIKALDMKVDADQIIQPVQVSLPPGGQIDPNQAAVASQPRAGQPEPNL